MLYTIVVGTMAPNYNITLNVLRQQVYLGIQGRRHVKIKGWEFASIPAPGAGFTGVLVSIDEFADKSSNSIYGSYTYAFLHNQHVHPFDLDLGVQYLNGFLTFTITTQDTATLAGLNHVLYLEIGDENKYPLLN